MSKTAEEVLKYWEDKNETADFRVNEYLTMRECRIKAMEEFSSSKDARIKELEARLETDDKSQFDLIPLPVSFLEWVEYNKWQRLHESEGGTWFKVGEAYLSLTTLELYNIFVNEMNQESTHS
jgi:hypothetical protein